MNKWDLSWPPVIITALAIAAFASVLWGGRAEVAHPYVAEYQDCIEGDRGPLECKAALTEAARENEGEALARQVAIDITEYRRAVKGPAESAQEE